MLRSLSCLAVLALLFASVATADEKDSPKKQAAPEAKEVKSEKAPEAKSEKPAIPGWVPNELKATPAGKRLAQIQADLDAAMAKRGPAREEADKARHLAFKAEQKAEDLKRIVLALEAEKMRVLERGMAQAHEEAQQKVSFETSQKVSKLEAQLREVTAQLVSVKKQTPQAPAVCKDCKHKDGKAEKGKSEAKQEKKEKKPQPEADKSGKQGEKKGEKKGE